MYLQLLSLISGYKTKDLLIGNTNLGSMAKMTHQFALRGITIEGVRDCIECTLTDNGLYSPDLLYRFFPTSRIQIVQETGNDREENGYHKSNLELEAESYGFDMKHTIWVDTLDQLKFWTNNGRNLLLLSAISVYDKPKTKSRPEMIYGKEHDG